MWTLICLTPAALLFAHQIRQAKLSQSTAAPTMSDIPVIVLIGQELEEL